MERPYRTACIPAFAHAVQHVGSGAQPHAPCLHQPQAGGLCLGAAIQSPIRRSTGLAAFSRTGLPHSAWLGLLLWHRDLVEAAALSRRTLRSATQTGPFCRLGPLRGVRTEPGAGREPIRMGGAVVGSGVPLRDLELDYGSNHFL